MQAGLTHLQISASSKHGHSLGENVVQGIGRPLSSNFPEQQECALVKLKTSFSGPGSTCMRHSHIQFKVSACEARLEIWDAARCPRAALKGAREEMRAR